MYLNKYSARVLSKGKPLKEINQYVHLKHKQEFELSLKNENKNDCAAYVKMDDVLIGIYEIRAYEKIIIDSGINDNGKFIFLKKNTKEFNSIDLNKIDKNKLGLIDIEFYELNQEEYSQKTIILPYAVPVPNSYPIFQPMYPVTPNDYPIKYPIISWNSTCNSSYAGGIGVQGESDKLYNPVTNTNINYNKEPTKIYLRLICEKSNKNEKKIRSKTLYSTSIPKPI